MISQGAVSINGAKIGAEEISCENMTEFIIKLGKRKFKKIVIE
jgi:tyrosyl-tRNA synthetase